MCMHMYIYIFPFLLLASSCIVKFSGPIFLVTRPTRPTPKDRNETRCDTLPARARERGSSEIVGFPLGVAFLLFLKNSWA